MIITIAGKPYSKIREISDFIANKHEFNQLCSENLYQKYAKENKTSLLDFYSSDLVKECDEQIIKYMLSVYHTMLGENVIVESEIAWNFMPKAFNVFIDVDNYTILKLKNEDKEQALKIFGLNKYRHKTNLNADCENLDNYTYVIDSSKLSPEQVADAIYKEYINFCKNNNL